MKRRLGRLLLGLAALGIGLGVLVAVQGGNGAPLLMGGAFAGVLGGAFFLGQGAQPDSDGGWSSDSTSSGPDQGGGEGAGDAGGDGGCGGDGGGE